jgi:hypothetical protein
MRGGQYLSIIRLKLVLRRGQDRTLGVKHQIQLQAGSRLAITEGIEFAQSGDAAVKDATPPLAVDVVRQITGQ